MTPTAELRFVEREAKRVTDNKTYTVVVRILQQKWRHKDWPIVIETEWRDVPLEKEE